MAEQFSDPENKFLTGHHRDTLWEKAYMLVGMENLMVYFLKNKVRPLAGAAAA